MNYKNGKEGTGREEECTCLPFIDPFELVMLGHFSNCPKRKKDKGREDVGV